MLALNRALRLIRLFHDINQQSLASKLNISRSHLSEIESGKKPVSISLLAKYSMVFNIPASSLMLFSERLASNKISEKTRFFISDKILNILEWMSIQENEKNDSTT